MVANPTQKKGVVIFSRRVTFPAASVIIWKGRRLNRRPCLRATVRGWPEGISKERFMRRRQQRPAISQAGGAPGFCALTLCFAVGQGILAALRLIQRASSTRRRWYDCTGWVSRLTAPGWGWQMGLESRVCWLALAHLS